MKRKAPSPLARVLASSSKRDVVVKRFFEIMPVSGIRQAVSQLANHRHFSSAIKISHPSLIKFYSQQTPDVPFEKDVAWSLGILDLYKTDVQCALKAEGKILASLLKGEWSEIERLLDGVDEHSGLSMWSLGLRGAALTAQGRAEDKRKLLTSLNASAGGNRFFSSVLYLKMNRLDEADILSGQSRTFEQKIKRMFSAETLHFLMYKIVQHSFEFDLDFALVLRVEKNSCPIDIFNTLQDFVLYSRFSCVEHRYPELVRTVALALGKVGGEYSNRSLAAAYGANVEFSMPESAYKILDLYTIGNYAEVCEIMEAEPELSENFILCETWARAAARCLRFPSGYLGKLLNAMASVLQKDADFGISNAFLLAQCESFGGLSWFRELHFFVARETLFLPQARNAELRWISWAISAVDTPLKLSVLSEPVRSVFTQALSKMATDHIVVRFIQAALTGPTSWRQFPLGVERIRLAKYLALSYAQKGFFTRALRILRLLATSEDRIVSYDATREIVALLIQTGNDEEAVQRYVYSVINNPALQKAFDTDSIAAACERLVRTSRSIAVPIALSLHSRYIDDRYDATLRYSFEVFLSRSALQRPEDIIGLNIEPNLVNYFLEYVAIPSVMKLLPTFDTLADIENCRIAVCRLLIEKSHNVEVMIDEVKNRNRQLVIAAGTKLIESSRIYADTDCFSNIGTSAPYRQLYDRYVNLLRKNEHDGAPDEVEFSRLVKQFAKEPFLLTVIHKVHVQHMVLNEKNATFLQLLKVMRDEFTFGVRGLSGYLSTRIRHGHLPNILRRAISDQGLMFSRNLTTRSYRDDAEWYMSIRNVQVNRDADLNKAFQEFSAKVDAVIDEVNDEWLQIFAVDQDISGLSSAVAKQKHLFNYSVTALESFYLQVQLMPGSDYSDFVRLVVNWLWTRTERNLQDIREKLSKGVRPLLISAIEEFGRSVSQLKEGAFGCEAFEDSVSRAKTTLNSAIDIAEGWFVRSRGATPKNFESIVPIEIARLSAQVRNLQHDDSGGILFNGATLSYFVDFLYVLLDNAVTKSGLEEEVCVNTSFSVDGEELIIQISNDCIPVVDVDWANEELDFYREHYGKETYALTAAQGEGGSGFFKVWKALTKDLELFHKIWFGYISADRFEVRISLKLSDLSKVLYANPTC